ncbi:MAG TPA: hypothetical protein VKD70_12505 [Candidatus Acidoferrum sp.]|nr:hypothetical protein [Candidatus Acidoferrum sp.]
MVVVFFLASLAAAVGISWLLAWLFKIPVENLLRYLVERDVAEAWTKYVFFLLLVVGVASGTRIRLLEEYLAAPSWNQTAIQSQMTQAFWVLEMYRTVLGSVEGIAWMLVLLALVGFGAYFVVRKNKAHEAQTAGNTKNGATTAS